MRFDFKKIASVLASVAMVSSTAGMALAASYPEPFVIDGSPDGAIVVTSGSHAGSTVDWDAAVSIQTDLNSKVTTTGGTEATGGESLKLEKSTNKLNMNDALTDVWTTKITSDHLPTILADGTLRSDDNIDYNYEQTIELAPAAITTMNFTHFADNDYKDKEPSLGIKIDRNKYVLNYTLDFLKYPRSDVSGSGSSGRLEDIEDVDITILGKTYKLLNAYNKSSSTKFELMTGAVTDRINLNEEKTETVEGKTYTVTLIYVDSDEAQFEVVDSEGNTQTTTKLAKGGTYKLDDGTQLGVTDISYQSFAGGVMSAEFTLGANKITIENGQVLEIDDEDVNDINCYIERSEVEANKVDIKKIVLEWKTNDELFITDEQSVTMPGLGSIKFTAGEFTIPMDEKIVIEPSGSYGIDLTIPIKDGDAKVGLLYGNTTDFTDIADDDDGTGILRTSTTGAGGSIVFDLDTDEYFFATWNDTDSGESYLLDVSSITEDTSVHRNYTTIRNVVTGETIASNKKEGDIVTIGEIELTVNTVNKDEKTVNFTINSGGSFNHVITKGGLYIWLPYNSTIAGERQGVTKGVLYNSTEKATQIGAAQKFYLWMAEEDKDGNIGSGEIFNVTLTHASDKAEAQADKATGKWSAADVKEIGDTEVYEGYIASDLATRILYHQPSGSQNWVEVFYHGDEAYANVFIAEEGVSINGEESILVVKDTEVNSVKDNNLIVVGGSCINSVAAEVLGVSYPTCGESFTAATNVGSGQYLIKAVTSPYNSAKTAVLVAGYEAADTKNAADKLKEGHATDVGTSNIYPVTTA